MVRRSGLGNTSGDHTHQGIRGINTPRADITSFYPLLLVAAFFGTLGTSASETAPFLPIEQAILLQTVAPEQQTILFARYNLVASFAGAAGALVVGLPDLQAPVRLSSSLRVRLLFGVYEVVALVVAWLSSQLTPAVEAVRMSEQEGLSRWQRIIPSLGRARGIVLGLAGLFSMDALAGGLVVQSLLALFFHLRFGVPLASLAVLFFGANLLSLSIPSTGRQAMKLTIDGTDRVPVSIFQYPQRVVRQ